MGDAFKLPGLRMVAKQIPRESCAPSLPGGEVSTLAFGDLVQSTVICSWHYVCDMSHFFKRIAHIISFIGRSVHAASQDEHWMAYLKHGELLKVAPESPRSLRRIWDIHKRGMGTGAPE
jgi:hypothetical protein